MTQLNLPSRRRVVAVFGFSLVALVVIVRVVLAISPARSSSAVQVVPNIAITKSPDTQEIAQGGTATFDILVTNTGLANLQDVTVSDSLAPDCNRSIGELNIGASHSYTCTRANVTQSFLNEAVVTGQTNLGLQASDSDTAFVKVLNPAIKILKTPETQTILRGGTAAFDINVINLGAVELTEVEVVDALAPNCNRTFNTLDADASASYSCQKSNVNDAFVNIAIVQATDGSQTVSDSDSAVVEILDLDVVLVANPTTLVEPGGIVLFTVTVTNESSVDVTLTSLNSNRYGELTAAGNNSVENNDCADSPSPTLAANGGQHTCTFEATFSEQRGAYQVTLTATAENVIQVSANDSATVTITAPPTKFLYLPVILDISDEPNNSCAQAFPIAINRDLFFLANDTQDWYRFDLPHTTNNLTVELTNFVPVAGQMVVYAAGAGGCSSLQFLGSNGDFSSTKIVRLGQRAPGRYYVRIINDGPSNNQDPYKLRVRAP
ncbi:MAG TPA: hypothetical protein VF177_01210 [Anaerolineae bacterium]